MSAPDLLPVALIASIAMRRAIAPNGLPRGEIRLILPRSDNDLHYEHCYQRTTHDQVVEAMTRYVTEGDRTALDEVHGRLVDNLLLVKDDKGYYLYDNPSVRVHLGLD